MRAQKTPATLACAVALLACSMTATAQSGAPGASGNQSGGDSPPRIVSRNDSKAWDKPTAFGKIPPELKERGDANCRAAGFERASGYSAEALDSNGQRFPAGGYFCTGSIKQSQQSDH